MNLSRRKLFGIGTAVAAAAAVPEIADAKPPSEAVGPMMFEHTCDGGKSRYTHQQVSDWEKECPWKTWGCGTTFRFWWGMPAHCPNCGYAYMVTIEDVKAGFYRRIQ